MLICQMTALYVELREMSRFVLHFGAARKFLKLMEVKKSFLFQSLMPQWTSQIQQEWGMVIHHFTLGVLVKQEQISEN